MPLVLIDSHADEASPDDDEPAFHTPLPDLQGAHLLVVDDEPDARELVRNVLEAQGARVTAVTSADEALAFLQSAKPDLIISDVGMPGVDGYQMMRTFREREPTSRTVPALALTAFARAEDRKRAMLAGYQAHLAKPFDIAEFVLVVAGLINRT